jgi:RNA 2',3'-cyclic 3'-phosphodiesterase
VTTGLRRGFLAVVPPPVVLRWAESLAESVRRDGGTLRWMRPDQRHLTLQFLGRVDDSVVDSLAESVAESVRRIPPFTLALGGAGAFPSPRRASVLWLGVTTGAAELAALAGAIDGATAPLGFDTDDRPFRAHLTLARDNRARDVRSLVEQLSTGPAGPPFTVDHVVLFESDTRPEGAVHTERIRFALGGASGPSSLREGRGSAPC